MIEELNFLESEYSKANPPLGIFDEAIEAITAKIDDQEKDEIQKIVSGVRATAKDWSSDEGSAHYRDFLNGNFLTTNPATLAKETIAVGTESSLLIINTLTAAALIFGGLAGAVTNPQGQETAATIISTGFIELCTNYVIGWLSSKFYREKDSGYVSSKRMFSLLNAVTGKGDESLQQALLVEFDKNKLTKPEKLFLFIFGKMQDITKLTISRNSKNVNAD